MKSRAPNTQTWAIAHAYTCRLMLLGFLLGQAPSLFDSLFALLLGATFL